MRFVGGMVARSLLVFPRWTLDIDGSIGCQQLEQLHSYSHLDTERRSPDAQKHIVKSAASHLHRQTTFTWSLLDHITLCICTCIPLSTSHHSIEHQLLVSVSDVILDIE